MKYICIIIAMLSITAKAALMQSGEIPYDTPIQTGAVVIASTTITVNDVTGSLESNLVFRVEVGGDYVPTSRKVNGKALTGNVNLSATDVGALPAEWAYGTWDLPGDGIEFGGGSETRSKFSSQGIYIIDDGGELYLDMFFGSSGNASEGISGTWVWPDTDSLSPLIKRDELDEALSNISSIDPNALPKSGGTMTGPLILSPLGITYNGVGIDTNFVIRAEFDGTNVSFNVYEVSK